MYNHQPDTFIKTADLGSFGKAGEALYISSTAVIQQMNLLENLCGFKLFVRPDHGVKLTPAGRSLYEDAKTLIHFSEDALQKARLLAASSESTLRTRTSLLHKCRMLPDLWPKVNEIQPDLRIEIRPMKEYENRTTVFSRLGLDFDLFEGIYASVWKGSCQFLELKWPPLCCAVSRNHRLAKASELSMQDLSGEVLVMPVKGVSDEMDSFREKVLSDCPSAKVIDSLSCKRNSSATISFLFICFLRQIHSYSVLLTDRCHDGNRYTGRDVAAHHVKRKRACFRLSVFIISGNHDCFCRGNRRMKLESATYQVYLTSKTIPAITKTIP